jgi:hypothetical protein
MSAPLVFMDTETTGLSLDDDIWEFAAIRREPDGAEMEFHMFIEHSRAKCERLPISFRDDHYGRYLDHKAYTQKEACSLIADIFRSGKPHVIGAVPNFDTERIAKMCRDVDEFLPQWHYHLIDVENLAVGWLARDGRGHLNMAPPWDSNELSKAVGVAPERFDRHTAMGDVRWAMAIYDAVMGGAA